MIEVKKAKREKLKAAVNLMGPSGSAKTYSALRMAKGIIDGMFPDMDEEEKWEKIGLLDTEHRRALLYADNEKDGVYIGEYLHVDLEPPHSVERYVEGIRALKAAGCEVVIADSMSHAWQGEGGILQQQNDAGGRFQDWQKVRPIERQLWAEIFDKNDAHMITTMRVKQDYALANNDVGKLEVQKLGLKSVQNDQLEYEYMVNLRTEMNHKVWASKDNTGLFDETIPFQIEEEHGEKLFNWLEKGEDIRSQEAKERREAVEEIQRLREEYPEVEKAVTSIEKHPSVKTKLEDMDKNFVKRTFQKVNQIIEDIEQSEEIGEPEVGEA